MAPGRTPPAGAKRRPPPTGLILLGALIALTGALGAVAGVVHWRSNPDLVHNQAGWQEMLRLGVALCCLWAVTGCGLLCGYRWAAKTYSLCVIVLAIALVVGPVAHPYVILYVMEGRGPFGFVLFASLFLPLFCTGVLLLPRSLWRTRR